MAREFCVSCERLFDGVDGFRLKDSRWRCRDCLSEAVGKYADLCNECDELSNQVDDLTYEKERADGLEAVLNLLPSTVFKQTITDTVTPLYHPRYADEVFYWTGRPNGDAKNEGGSISCRVSECYLSLDLALKAATKQGIELGELPIEDLRRR